MMREYKKIQENLNFINISTEEFSLFEWKPLSSHKSFILDLNIVKMNPISDIFFHINKGNMKIIHIRKKKLIYTIGANNELQFQLLEALLEQLSLEFNDMYDAEVILSYGTFSSDIFRNFNNNIEKIITNFYELNLIKNVKVFCTVCNKVLPLIVKKSFINNADSYPVPLVYIHEGHAILCFIDKNFDVRGVELVNITG